METWVSSWIGWLLAALALPKVGLSAVFVISLVSATLLPMGSEPAVFGLVKLAPHLFWPAIAVATLGNTLGGMISYSMGAAAEKAYQAWHQKYEHKAALAGDGATQGRPEGPRRKSGGRWHEHISRLARHMGPAVLFFSWLPVVGDPLCAVAGWLRLSFWPCVIYMALGKFLRYAAMTAWLMWMFPNV